MLHQIALQIVDLILNEIQINALRLKTFLRILERTYDGFDVLQLENVIRLQANRSLAGECHLTTFVLFTSQPPRNEDAACYSCRKISLQVFCTNSRDFAKKNTVIGISGLQKFHKSKNHKNLNLFCAGFTKAYQAKNEISQFLEFWGLWDRSQLTSERERRMLQNELFQAKKPRRYGRERSL